MEPNWVGALAVEGSPKFFKPAHLELPEPEINAEKCSCIRFESPGVMLRKCSPRNGKCNYQEPQSGVKDYTEAA